MADIHKDRVLASYESLWTSRLYSDLIIRCGSNEYKVHQSVICPRSVFFTKACNGVLKVSTSKDKCSKANSCDRKQKQPPPSSRMMTIHRPSDVCFHTYTHWITRMGDCLTTQSRPLSLSQHFRHTCGTRFKQRLVERVAQGGLRR